VVLSSQERSWCCQATMQHDRPSTLAV